MCACQLSFFFESNLKMHRYNDRQIAGALIDADRSLWRSIPDSSSTILEQSKLLTRRAVKGLEKGIMITPSGTVCSTH